MGDVYVKAVINMNIYDEIRGYDRPVLLIHGTRDEIVDISYSRKGGKCTNSANISDRRRRPHVQQR